MKKNIKLSNLNGFELKTDESSTIIAGQAGFCDWACGCSCACNTNDETGKTNNKNGSASSTESSGYAQDGTWLGIGILIAIGF